MNSARPITDVRLRAMEPEDLDMLYAMENDDTLWQVGNTNVPYSRYVLHDYIASATNDIYADGQVRLVVIAPSDETVGLVDVVNFSAAHRRAEVSIVIRSDCRRRGYALSALTQVASYALRVLHLHQLYAVIAASNEASLRLFAAAGYKQEATLRDWLYDGRDYTDARVVQLFL